VVLLRLWSTSADKAGPKPHIPDQNQLLRKSTLLSTDNEVDVAAPTPEDRLPNPHGADETGVFHG
jgi:hypothetical protein